MNRKLPLLAITLSIPFVCLAHGEEVLYPIFIQFGSILVFLFILLLIKMKRSWKRTLALTYFITLVMIVLLTSNIPYRENRTVLDLIISLGPALAAIIAFVVLKDQEK